MVLDGWRCPACLRIIAPTVVACPFCDGTEGGVKAPREPVTPTGPVTVQIHMLGDEIARAIQPYLLASQRRNRPSGLAAGLTSPL